MFNQKNISKPLILGFIISIITTFTFLVLFAFAAINLDFSNDILLALSLTSMNLGVFFGGFSSGKLSKEKGLVIGGINGLIFFMIVTLISLIFNEKAMTIVSLIKLITFIISSMIGGIIGVNFKRKRHF